MPCSSIPVTRRDLFASTMKLAAAAGLTLSPLAGAVARAVDGMEQCHWNACVINCGQRCPLRLFTRNGQVIRIETDNTLADDQQVRACVRGRSTRQRLYSPDRLKYPMKRIGERGQGRFMRISWDEAYREIAGRLKYTIAKYGSDAVYWQYCSGQQSLVNSRRAWWRLLNLTGGYLKYYGSYSTAQIGEAFPYTYGGRISSDSKEIANARLYVAFGNNPAMTRNSGGGKSWQINQAMDRAESLRSIIIDPIYSDTCVNTGAQWIPIRVGTDAALVEAIAYELINHQWVDEAFLARYCIGYDESTLPASAPARSDYKNYILGRGADGIAKTPERASTITGIPVETIVSLAREIGTTKPCFIAQGWGPQRQANGEQTSRAIAMLPLLIGQVGLPGTNTGETEGNTSFPAVYLPVGKNPVKATIPVFLWTDAIARGTEMTAKTDGIRGVKQLQNNIKMLINSGGNTLINQHSDSNRTDEILRDTKKCEFIVVCDNVMTPSCRYADILLPDVMGAETDDITAQGGSNGATVGLLAMHKAVEPQWEQRSSWEICRGLARELGLEEAFTEGRTQMQWVQWCYEQTRQKVPQLPDFEVFWKGGRTGVERPGPGIALQAFRQDPQANPLKTPSGKIEIYSERLARRAQEWTLPEGDVISALPQFVRTWEMPGDPLQKQYPLQCFGYHGHGRIHSTFHNIAWLRESHPDWVLINTVDAASRQIADGDPVRVYNDRGTVLLPAHVTSRIIPGVVAIPQGAWYKPVKQQGRTLDVGGNINTLTSQRPSPLAKGNPQHTNLVQVSKA